MFDIDRAAERYYDRLYDRYYSDCEDAWDHDDPDWTWVDDYYASSDSEKINAEIADLVRDYIEYGNDDERLYKAGLLDRYIHPEERIGTDDPDREWEMIDKVITREWDNNEFMLHIWENDETTRKAICEKIKAQVDDGDYPEIRKHYNDCHENNWED